MYQYFCKELGFGNKSYALLKLNSKTKVALLSGKNSNYKLLKKKLKKNCKSLIHYKIGKERGSEKKIKFIRNDIKKNKSDIVIAMGGGSIIDFTKRVFINLENKKLYIFPTLPGSGAESSITSVINSNTKKIFYINNKQMPTGIIYDENLILGCPKKLLLRGIIDSFTHCIESSLTINQNEYLNFLGKETLDYFINRNTLKSLNKINSKNIKDISLLSFNGGIAQCNAGSGLCHALAHTAEELTGENHTKCIVYFLMPVLNYYNKKNKSELKKFNPIIYSYLKGLIKKIKKDDSFTKLNNLILDMKKFDILINNSKNDLCWRLYNKNVDINLLKKEIINAAS